MSKAKKGSMAGLDVSQVKKAVEALAKHSGNDGKQLFDDPEFIYLDIALAATPREVGKPKPRALPLPHPIYDPESADICLLVKDTDGTGHKEAKKFAAAFANNAGVAKVIGVSKLKTKYESFEAKRALCNAYDIFLADDRIIPSLPKLIGKSFFKKKKVPIPVKLSRKNWANAVSKACGATYLHPSAGSTVSLRVAKEGMENKEVLANIRAALNGALEYLPKKWASVQALYLKTASSVSLPVYQVAPDAPLKIA